MPWQWWPKSKQLYNANVCLSKCQNVRSRVALRPRPPLPPPRHSAPTYFHCNLSTSLFALLNFSLEKLISIQPDLNHLSLISVTTALKRTPFVIFECIYLYMIYVYTYIYMYIYMYIYNIFKIMYVDTRIYICMYVHTRTNTYILDCNLIPARLWLSKNLRACYPQTFTKQNNPSHISKLISGKPVLTKLTSLKFDTEVLILRN